MFTCHLRLAILLTSAAFTLNAVNAVEYTTAQSTYYINPTTGNDTQTGRSKEDAWKTFRPANRLMLSSGDRIEITAPGSFKDTLHIRGSGTATAPIEVHFAPGRYDIYPDKLLRRQFNISNTNDYPDAGKAIAILVEGARHVKISGKGARLICRGKMMQVCIDGSESITIEGLAFDYHRPTVSEFTVVKTGEDYADLQIHLDSKYELINGRINWIGEGWFYNDPPLMQILDPKTDLLKRSRNLIKGLRVEELKPFLVRVHGTHKLKDGFIYHLRETGRDYASVFTRRSKDVSWKQIHFHFLHGMGIVSQFSENLSFEGVHIAPAPESGRTCAAWADGIHASGCRGKIIVKDCFFSGLQDDAINIHGTHLRVIEKVSEKQIKVRFMHKQTFGFMAFNPGEEVLFTQWDTLENYGANSIKSAVLLEPKVMLLTMNHPITDQLRENDALENVTWTPEAIVTGNKVMRVPTRGFLFTTRRQLIVKDNCFHRTRMSAILIENDAKGWYESGPVRDMTISGNRFFFCREPVIYFNPQNSEANPAVHRNIRITGNAFALNSKVAIKARSTSSVSIKDNTVYSAKPTTDAEAMVAEDAAGILIESNRHLPIAEWPYTFEKPAL